MHDRNWRTFCFPWKILLWKQRPFWAPWVFREDPFCEKKRSIGPPHFPGRSFVWNHRSIGPPPVSTKVPSKKKWRPIGRTSVFQKGPFVWKRRPIGRPVFSMKVPSVKMETHWTTFGFPRRSFLWEPWGGPFPLQEVCQITKAKKLKSVLIAFQGTPTMSGSGITTPVQQTLQQVASLGV